MKHAIRSSMVPCLCLLCAWTTAARAENIVFPEDAGVVDVTRPPYHARGDGVHDDTAALQQALTDHPNDNRIIYLPNGTYLVSNRLDWPPGNRGGQEYKRTILQGQSRDGAVIRLKDNCPDYGDPGHRKAVIWTGPKPAQHIWARQLNTESGRDTNILNNGATLWILGLRTEQEMCKIDTVDGGRTELLGAHIYAQGDKKLHPLLRIHEAQASFACVRQISYNNAWYETVVEETRGGTTRTLSRKESGNTLALYVGREE